jgi:predicted nucleic acid-binding protein
MPKRTYLDSNVLLAAFKKNSKAASHAIQILDDPDRTLLVSDAVWLEIMPKPVYEKQREEIEFYEAIFSEAERLEWNLSTLVHAANVAQQYGIAAMDAIHVAYALDAQSEELVTAEKSTKPMFRAQGIKILSIQEDIT